MVKNWHVLLLIVFLDQLTKALVVAFQPNVQWPLLNLIFTTNTGIAFGLFQGANLIFIIVTIAILIGLYKYKEHFSTPLQNIALGLIAGGAIGNLIDRIFRGAVIDFIDLHLFQFHWPAFNIADAAIVIGVLLLVFKK